MDNSRNFIQDLVCVLFPFLLYFFVAVIFGA